jgi:hypothetical protein
MVNYPRRHDSGADPVPLPAGVGYAFYTAQIQRHQLSAAGTYQFLENTFAHPYLSAGAQVGFVNIHKVRDMSVPVYYGRTAYQVPPLDQRESLVQVRPFLAGGFKSYFNERAFVRSEVSTGFSRRGLSQFVLRLGFGVDF